MSDLRLAKFSQYFRPRLIDALRGYDKTRFTTDIIAGITVGVIALPLAIAFAIASGAKPEAGIFTAIIAGFIISALGGSRVQIGGPTGAFIVIVYGIIMQYGYANLLICTMMAGGADAHGQSHPIFPASADHRFHQRYRGADHPEPSERILRFADRGDACRFYT
jgi:hypothetical protein